VFNPESKIETKTKEVVSGGFPISPFPRNDQAVTRGPNLGPLNRDNRNNEEEAYEDK